MTTSRDANEKGNNTKEHVSYENFKVFTSRVSLCIPAMILCPSEYSYICSITRVHLDYLILPMSCVIISLLVGNQLIISLIDIPVSHIYHLDDT